MEGRGETEAKGEDSIFGGSNFQLIQLKGEIQNFGHKGGTP